MGRGRPLHGSDSSRDDALPFKGVMQGPPPMVRFACMHACMSTVLSAHAYIYMHDEHGVYFPLVHASFQCHHVQQRGLPSSWEEEVFSCWLWQCHSSRPQQTHTWEEEGHAIGPDGLGRLPAAGVAARHHHRPRE